MYVFRVDVHVTTRDIRVNAVFEQENRGKTQRLTNKGITAPLPEPVRILSHAYILQVIDQYVALLIEDMLVQLPGELDF